MTKKISSISLTLTSLCLGTIGIFVKLIGNNVHYLSLNFLRVFLGFLTLALVMTFIRKNWYKINLSSMKEFILIGFLYAISLSLYTTAIHFTTIQNAVLINATYPFFVMIFARFMLGELITIHKIIALLLGFTGLSIMNPFSFDFEDAKNIGNMLALIGSIFYALLIVNMKKEEKQRGIEDVTWFLLIASLFLLPFFILKGMGNINKALIYVIGLGVISTGLAYLFYNLTLKYLEADIASILVTTLTPIVSISLAVIIIGEKLTTATILGGTLLIFASVYLEMHNIKIKRIAQFKKLKLFTHLKKVRETS